MQHRFVPTVHTAAVLSLSILCGCSDRESPTAVDETTPQASLAAPVLSAVQFLPPVGSSAASGPFDDRLLDHLVVQACWGNGSGCASEAARFDAGGSGPARLRVSAEEGGHYHVNWKTERGMSGAYRIRVLAGGAELGGTTVQLDGKGSTLPVKFRVARGVVGIAGPGASILTLAGGAVTLGLPQGAVRSAIAITATPIESAQVVPGTAYEFAPDGAVFNPAASLTIRYDEGALPNGASEQSLRLAHRVNGAWQEVAGSIVDASANTVRGAIGGFSAYGVIVHTTPGGTVQTMWGTGTATIDGILNVMEWGYAARRQFTVNLPSGPPATGEYYVMNDANNVYIAFELPRRPSLIDNQQIAITIGDDHLLVAVLGTFNTQVLFMDAFQNFANLSCGAPCMDPDHDWGGVLNGNAAATMFGTSTFIELQHPLNSGDGHDIAAAPGDLLPFRFRLSLDGGGPPFSDEPNAGTALNLLISGTPIFSAQGTAVIDGVIDANDDWSTASCQSVQVVIAGSLQPPRQLCVMNDATNLYFSLASVGNGNTSGGLAVDLDSNNSHSIDDGDDALTQSYSFGAGPSAFFDGWWSFTSCPPGCFVPDASTGGVSHGAGSSTTGAIEIAHPLNSGDAKDIAKFPGQVVGVRLRVNISTMVFVPPGPGQPGGNVSMSGTVVFPANGLATIYLR